MFNNIGLLGWILIVALSPIQFVLDLFFQPRKAWRKIKGFFEYFTSRPYRIVVAGLILLSYFLVYSCGKIS